MIGQLSKLHLGVLAAFLIAVTLPVTAEDAAKGSGEDCPTAAGLSGLRSVPETRSSSVLRALPLELQAVVETGHGTIWSRASDVEAEDQGADHDTSTRSGRLVRLLHHVTWSWAPASRYGDPFQTSAMPNRP
jgi:hypothetical protein